MPKHCRLTEMHLTIRPDGVAKPCSRFRLMEDYRLAEHVLGDPDPTTLLESEPWRALRRRLGRGETPSSCSGCWQEEDHGVQSKRESYNARFDAQAAPSLRYLDVAFGNHCNLKCRHCDSLNSSKWHEDDLVLARSFPDRNVVAPTIDKDFRWTRDQIATIERVKFTGGEPFLHPHFGRFIDLFDDAQAGRVSLDVFTNCTWKPKKKIIESLQRFGHVRISLSIDGIGDVSDYIRHPSRWSTVEKVASFWLEASKELGFEVWWTPTIMIYNVMTFKEMVDWWLSMRARFGLEVIAPDHFFATMNELSFPTYLEVCQLPDDIKNDVVDGLRFTEYDPAVVALLDEKVTKRIRAMLRRRNSHPEEFLRLCEYTQLLDEMRGENLDRSVPKLAAALRHHQRDLLRR